MDGWNTTFLLDFGLFSGAFAVSFREGTFLGSGIPPNKPSICHHYWEGGQRDNPKLWHGFFSPKFWSEETMFQIFFCFIPIRGEMIQFDYCNILQMGWFNHHLPGKPVATLISINLKPLKPAKPLPKKMVLSYVFQVNSDRRKPCIFWFEHVLPVRHLLQSFHASHPQISDVMSVRELTVGFRLVPEGKQRVNMNFYSWNWT